MGKISTFLSLAFTLFLAIVSFFGGALILAAGWGAFGWPTQDPIWLIVTVPVTMFIVACIFAAWIKYIGSPYA